MQASRALIKPTARQQPDLDPGLSPPQPGSCPAAGHQHQQPQAHLSVPGARALALPQALLSGGPAAQHKRGPGYSASGERGAVSRTGWAWETTNVRAQCCCSAGCQWCGEPSSRSWKLGRNTCCCQVPQCTFAGACFVPPSNRVSTATRPVLPLWALHLRVHAACRGCLNTEFRPKLAWFT